MVKYIKFKKVSDEFTTHEFRGGNEQVEVFLFDKPIASIKSDSEAAIDELIASQDVKIACQVISKEEFISLVKTTKQYERVCEIVKEKIAYLLKDIKTKYPEEERETWSTQLEEARKYKKTLNEDDAPFLKTLAENENDTVEAFANAVIQNNETFKALSASALSEKRKLKQQLLSEWGA
jgi:hypothetical protein